jgi:hypothetical protein
MSRPRQRKTPSAPPVRTTLIDLTQLTSLTGVFRATRSLARVLLLGGSGDKAGVRYHYDTGCGGCSFGSNYQPSDIARDKLREELWSDRESDSEAESESDRDSGPAGAPATPAAAPAAPEKTRHPRSTTKPSRDEKRHGHTEGALLGDRSQRRER